MKWHYISPAMDNKYNYNTEPSRSTSRENINILQVNFVSTFYNCSVLDCIWYFFQSLFMLYENDIMELLNLFCQEMG